MTTFESSEVLLDAYLRRICLDRPRAPTLEALADLTAHHAAVIPFENLDPRLGRPVQLDLEHLAEKLLLRRRGGYCFEHNTLFAAVLEALGFSVTRLEARVQPTPTPVVRARTHMVLAVDLLDGRYLVDVGFGGTGPVRPVPLDGREATEDVDTFRVSRLGDRRILESRAPETWVGSYVFTLEPASAIDYEVANHYTSTHPSSVFVRTLTAQLSPPGERLVLRGRTFTRRTRGAEEVRELDDREVGALLRAQMGLEVSDEELGRALAER